MSDNVEDALTNPIWIKKFAHWSTMQKGCIAARGPNGVYCSWAGRNCGYETCPRRIFEEVTVDPNSIKQPTPPPKIKNQIQTLQNTNKEQAKIIQDLTKRVEELEKNRV